MPAMEDRGALFALACSMEERQGGRSREERAAGGRRSKPTQHTKGCLLVALPGERSREEVLAGGQWWRALHGGREGGRAQHKERAREVERAGGRHQ